MNVDLGAMSKRAKQVLLELDEDITRNKRDAGFEPLPDYSKKHVCDNYPKLTRAALDNLIPAMEEKGYQFRTVNRGSVKNQVVLNHEDILKLYDERGIEKWRDSHECQVVFIQNLKGGAGKTISSVSLAQALSLSPQLAHKQLRVGLIDLDPQRSATMLLNNFYASHSFDYTAAQFMINPNCEGEFIYENGFVDTQLSNVKLMPSSISDAFVASNLHKEIQEVEDKPDNLNVYNTLKLSLIDKIKPYFDIIILDTGPHLDSFMLNSMVAADFVLMPIPPQQIDLHSTMTCLERLPSIQYLLKEEGCELNWKGFYGFMTKFSEHKSDHKSSRRRAISVLHDFLNSPLPMLEAFNKTSSNYETVMTIQPKQYGGSAESLINSRDSVIALAEELFSNIERQLEVGE